MKVLKKILDAYYGFRGRLQSQIKIKDNDKLVEKIAKNLNDAKPPNYINL